MLRKIKHLERVLRCKTTLIIISFVFFVLLAIYGFVKKEPAFRYNNNTEFINSLNKCIDHINRSLPYHQQIPTKLIQTQAALESNYGRSRFAIEGNNLMGIYQFKNLHTGMTPAKNPNASFRVAKFNSKCGSVRYYVELLNTKDYYLAFRNERKYQMENNVNDVYRYFNKFGKYSTNPEYPFLLTRTQKELVLLGF